ncbi:MAG: hypothetical protein ACK4PI_09395 [Tepidisphaerales bacterium]
MNDLWLRLIGLPASGPTAGGRVVETELVLGGGPFGGAMWLWLLLTAGLLAGVVWLYRRESAELSRGRRWTLGALRGAVVVLLMLMLLQPTLRVTRETEVRRQLLVLLDRSQSMALVDQRVEPEDLVRAAIAAGLADPAGGVQQPLPADADTLRLSRAELAVKALTDGRLRLLERLAPAVDVRVMTFGRDLREAAADGDEPDARPERASGGSDAPASGEGSGLDALSVERAVAAVRSLRPADDATALGNALRDAIERTRGQPLAGILLVTDGANNAGLSPVLAARRMAGTRPATRPTDPSATSGGDTLSGSVPLLIYGVGVTRPRDLAVLAVTTPQTVFVDDDVAVAVRLRSGGLAGQPARLTLQADGMVVAAETLTLPSDGEMTATLRWRPASGGSRRADVQLTARVEPLAGELTADNNAASTRVRVVEGRIRVLYVESRPRWEYKYVQAVLLRDRRVEAKFVLLDRAEPGAMPASGDGGPMLSRFPETREDLFRYDVVILGDVDPATLSREQLGWIETHVSQFGGGLVLMAGRRNMPWRWAGTPLERLVPVEWTASPVGGGRGADGPAAGSAGDVSETPRRLTLTPAGRMSEMLRLADDEAGNLALWASLPPVYWTAAVGRARPGAEVLLVDDDPTSPRRGGGTGETTASVGTPVVAVQRYGAGTTLFIGTDNLWRWRRNVGDRHHARLWGQIVLRMALPHLLGESRRTQLSADRRQYAAGENVTVFARLYGPTFEPIVRDRVTAVLRRADDAEQLTLQLRPVAEQPGLYRGESRVPAPGVWRLTVDTDDEASLDLDVTESRLEQLETALNELLLVELARLTGGAFFREEDLHRLPERLALRGDGLRTTHDAAVWASPLYFVLLIAAWSSEWGLRKGAGLK